MAFFQNIVGDYPSLFGPGHNYSVSSSIIYVYRCSPIHYLSSHSTINENADAYLHSRLPSYMFLIASFHPNLILYVFETTTSYMYHQFLLPILHPLPTRDYPFPTPLQIPIQMKLVPDIFVSKADTDRLLGVWESACYFCLFIEFNAVDGIQNNVFVQW